MTQMLDPTFYRSPGEAMAAPPEGLAYVAAYDPAGKAKDAMVVIDVEGSSASYGKVVAGPSCPRPATSCTTLAGTPARRRCVIRATAMVAGRWSVAT